MVQQSLPATAKALVSVDYNAGADGNVPGMAITRIPRAQLDEVDPSWRSMAPVAEVQHYTFDADNPKEFGVYPPNTGQYVHMVYNAIPTDCPTTAANIALGDEYEEALTQATIWYALADRAEDANMRIIRNDALTYLKMAVKIKVDTEEAAK